MKENKLENNSQAIENKEILELKAVMNNSQFKENLMSAYRNAVKNPDKFKEDTNTLISNLPKNYYTKSEGGSNSNADALNKKRRIRAIHPAPRRQMGHKFDTIFHANRKELGLIEVGKKIDQTKEMKDGLVKMLIVMHDMLINLATIKEFLRKVKVVGRVINVMDSPGGFVSRIRRSDPLEYPSCGEDFTFKNGVNWLYNDAANKICSC
ncbi:hypothetical protein BDC45DRAFT_559393 [Circinella umbellata]|nr:hypothetical protein BDC45DRAFT_559393 [Circinella umbellata]